jgi:molecular chaperone GrpE (heat shock protein)
MVEDFEKLKERVFLLLEQWEKKEEQHLALIHCLEQEKTQLQMDVADLKEQLAERDDELEKVHADKNYLLLKLDRLQQDAPRKRWFLF